MTSPQLNDLVGLLELEQLEQHIFRGNSRDLGTGRVFGGQVLGQAVSAAQRTCPGRAIHSVHSYFLRPGDFTKPIIYQVENTRDGRSYSARSVTAIQDGKPIFSLLCSLQSNEEGGFDYYNHCDVTPPESGLLSIDLEHEGIATYRTRTDRSKILQDLPFHIKIPDPETDDLDLPDRFWLKTSGPLPETDGIHQSMLAFVSDLRLLVSTLRPVGYRYKVTETMLATVCHAIWFHRPLRIDDWLFLQSEPVSLSSGRGLGRGAIYDSSGVLVVSTMQEGVVRKRRPNPSGD